MTLLELTGRLLAGMLGNPEVLNYKALGRSDSEFLVGLVNAALEMAKLVMAQTDGQRAPSSVGLGQPLGPLKDMLATYERDVIEAALIHTSGNQQAAARLLCVTGRTIYSKVRRYAI